MRSYFYTVIRINIVFGDFVGIVLQLKSLISSNAIEFIFVRSLKLALILSDYKIRSYVHRY